MSNDSLVILVRHTPYSSHHARAAMDLTLTAAAFDSDVGVVFMDEGVFQLISGQDTGTSGFKNVGKMIPALAAYDVDKVYVHTPSAARFSIEDEYAMDGLLPLDDEALKTLVQNARHVMVY
jgi:tRNA 2-thiouridine synthesizing protein C